MVTLTSPITAQNIVDRFKELVTDVADTNIVWGTDSLPGHSAFTSADFGGVVEGMSLVLINATGTFSANETVTGSLSGTVGTAVSYTSNTLKVRSIVPGAGQTNFLQNDVVFINIKSINVLARNWKLYPPSTSITKFSGNLFYEKEEYNIRTIVIALLINLVLVVYIGVRSQKQIKRRMQNEEFDTIL